jgi:LPS-assembly protein
LKNLFKRLSLVSVTGAVCLSIAAPPAFSAQPQEISFKGMTTKASPKPEPELSRKAAAREEPIDYTADKITYVQEQNIIRGDGNVVITCKGVSLKADKMVGHLDSGDIYADGNVIFSSGSQIFTGQKVHFNYKTMMGDFVNGSGFVDPWYAKGKTVRKTAENEYQMTDGYITSCNYENMHYKISAKKLFVYPGDRLVARDVVFWIGNMPVMWLPFFSRSLRDERERFSVVPGYNRRFGAFVLTGTNFWYDPYFTGTFHNDYYTKRGYGSGVDVQYRLPGFITNQGEVRSYLINDKGYEPSQPNIDPDGYRYRVAANHSMQITPDTLAVGQLRLQSDIDMINDYFRDEFEREVQPENYIDITKATDKYSLTFFARKQMNKLFTELEKLPEVKFVLTKQQIANTGIYFSDESSVSYLRYVPIDAADYQSFRADTYNSLSYPFNVFRFLNLEPFAGLRNTYYGKGPYSNNLFRNIFSTGVDTVTKIHKVFPNVYSPFWKINQLRHVIEPRVTYTYTHDPSELPTDLYQFDAVDTLDRRNDFRLSFRNKIQTRRNEETIDLVDFEIYGYLHPEDRTPSYDRFGLPHSFSDIYYYLKLRPLDWIALDFKLSQDIYNNLIDSVDTDLQVLNGDKWNLAFRYRYQPLSNTYLVNPYWNTYSVNNFAGNFTTDNPEGNNLVGVEFIYRLNSDWMGKVFYRYDFGLGKLEQQEYTVFRDLHCWEAAVTFRQRPLRDDWTLFVVFRLKDYPEVPIRFGN